jgi:hypothetical protein
LHIEEVSALVALASIMVVSIVVSIVVPIALAFTAVQRCGAG